MGDEATRADEWTELMQESRITRRSIEDGSNAQALRKRFQEVADAPSGATVACPVCKRRFVKSPPSKRFCSNGRSRRGRSSCKDIYHNVTSLDRLDRARRLGFV